MTYKKRQPCLSGWHSIISVFLVHLAVGNNHPYRRLKLFQWPLFLSVQNLHNTGSNVRIYFCLSSWKEDDCLFLVWASCHPSSL